MIIAFSLQLLMSRLAQHKINVQYELTHVSQLKKHMSTVFVVSLKVIARNIVYRFYTLRGINAYFYISIREGESMNLWGTECLNTRFFLPTLPYAEYSVKLIYLYISIPIHTYVILLFFYKLHLLMKSTDLRGEFV